MISELCQASPFRYESRMKKPLIITALFLTSLFVVEAGETRVEDFSGGVVPKGWTGVKGEWKVADGSLSGKELEADHHGAVFMIPDAHTDSTFSCRFQVNGAKGFGLSYNHEKGHLFRVRISPTEVVLALDKDKKDPASKPIHFGEAAVDFKAGEWYDLTCTVKGNTVEVVCAGEKLSGTNEKLTKGKTGYRFTVAGESVLVDDIAFSSSE